VFPLLDWAGIATVAERGVAIGSHGRTHRRLTLLDSSSVSDELEGSFDDLRRELGVAPTALAYPYGDALDRERRIAAGIYKLALSTELKRVDEDEDLHMLPRLDAYYLRVPGRLESFGTPAFTRYLRIRSRGRRLRASVDRLLGQGGG
jgi:peptidoglycan/xylan/chitin deacetylase (PgdA/CDA1 family)